MLSRHPLREGVVAGLLGAASVAAWFFVLDVVNGRPFFTPAVLGAKVLQMLGGEFGGRGHRLENRPSDLRADAESPT